MTTARDLLHDALAMTNSVGVDQTLTDAEAQIGLRQLNDLIEIWSLDDMAVYGLANQTFSTAVGQSVYTIGTGANWVTTRPVRINDNAYSVVNSVSFPCMKMTQEEYNNIPVKTQTQAYPDRFLYVNQYPLGLVTLWPVPSAITPVTFSIDRVLTAAVLDTDMSFPTGYLKAFKEALAVIAGPMYGANISNFPALVAESKMSLGAIRRANKKQRVMRCDSAYSDVSGGVVSWERGW